MTPAHSCIIRPMRLRTTDKALNIVLSIKYCRLLFQVYNILYSISKKKIVLIASPVYIHTYKKRALSIFVMFHKTSLNLTQTESMFSIFPDYTIEYQLIPMIAQRNTNRPAFLSGNQR